VRVLREGKPMAQASIKIRDFGLEKPRPYGDQQRFVIGLGGRRMNILWGLTDETGILELTGLPLDCKRIAGYASEGGQGRSFRVTFADAKQPYDIDLGP